MRARPALSATLDGEDPGVDPEWLERHRASCVACARWYADLTRLDRLVRVSPVGEPAADLTEGILPNIRLPRRGRWRLPLRIALIVVAAAQVVVGALFLVLPMEMQTGMRLGAHMDHEEAAFNMAFGVALLLVGCNTRRAATQLPVLGSFVAVLTVASVFDLADGNVGWSRLATHIPIVLGLLITAALSRGPHRNDGPAGNADRATAMGTGAGRSAPGDLPWIADDTASGHGNTPAAHRKIA